MSDFQLFWITMALFTATFTVCDIKGVSFFWWLLAYSLWLAVALIIWPIALAIEINIRLNKLKL